MADKISGRKTIKAGLWYVISNFILKGLSFLTTPIFTRIMSKSDIGYYSNFNSWLNILMIVVTLDLAGSIYLAVFDKKDSLDKYVSSILVLSTFSTLIVYIIVLLHKGFFLSFFNIDEYALHIMFLTVGVSSAVTMYSTKSRVVGNYKSVVFISLFVSIISTIVSVTLVSYYKLGVLGRIYGTFIPQIIINIVLYLYIIYKGKEIDVKMWKYALALSVPLIFHDLAHIVLSSSDRIMITQMLGNINTASYSIAYACGSIVSILYSSLNGAWAPWAYDCMDRKDANTIKRVVRPYSLMFLIIVFSGMMFAPEILWIMGGESYMSALNIIPVIMVSYIFVFVYSFYVNIEFFYKKQIFIAIGTICGALLNLFLNYLLLPIFGYEVAAYTTLAGYAFLFIYNYILVKCFGFSYYYDSKFFFGILAISLLMIPTMIILYKLTYLRLSISAIVLYAMFFIIYSNRKLLIDAVKNKSIAQISRVFSYQNIKNVFFRGRF